MEIIARGLLLAVVCTVGFCQNITTGCEGEADVLFLLDESTFVTSEQDFVDARDFIRNVIMEMDVAYTKTRVGLIIISDDPHIDISLNAHGNKESLVAAVDEIGDPFETSEVVDLSAALYLARTEAFAWSRGGREAMNDVLIFLISQDLPYNTSSVLREIDLLKEQQTSIIGIVFGANDTEQHMEQLRQIVSFPEENIFVTSNASLLSDKQEMIVNQICGEVPVCSVKIDMTFIMDSTGSIGFFGWLQLVDFVIDMVSELHVAPDAVRVAAITFAARATLEFGFDENTSRASLIQAIRNITYSEGAGTNVAGALQFLRENVHGSTGERPDAPDTVVVISDGSSNVRPYDVARESQRVKDLNYTVFAIGVGASGRSRFLRELNSISSDPDDEYTFPLDDFGNLGSVQENILKKACIKVPPKSGSAEDGVGAFLSNWGHRELSWMTDLYTEDATQMQAGMPTIFGKEAIRKNFDRMSAAGFTLVNNTLVDRRQLCDDWAVTKSEVKRILPNGNIQSARSMRIWQKIGDQWYIWANMFVVD